MLQYNQFLLVHMLNELQQYDVLDHQEELLLFPYLAPNHMQESIKHVNYFYVTDCSLILLSRGKAFGLWVLTLGRLEGEANSDFKES